VEFNAPLDDNQAQAAAGPIADIFAAIESLENEFLIFR
jgi:hypothetical protein